MRKVSEVSVISVFHYIYSIYTILLGPTIRRRLAIARRHQIFARRHLASKTRRQIFKTRRLAIAKVESPLTAYQDISVIVIKTDNVN